MIGALWLMVLALNTGYALEVACAARAIANSSNDVIGVACRPGFHRSFGLGGLSVGGPECSPSGG